MMELTTQELKMIVNIVARVTVPVAEAPQLIAIINKISRIIDERDRERKGSFGDVRVPSGENDR